MGVVESAAMDATVQVALAAGGAALVSAIVTSLLAPHINWGIEKKKEKFAYKRKLIADWRAMLAEAAQENVGGDDVKLLAYLEKDKYYYSLTSHIPNDKDAYAKYRKRHATASTPVFLRYLSDVIARLEKEWGLL